MQNLILRQSSSRLSTLWWIQPPQHYHFHHIHKCVTRKNLQWQLGLSSNMLGTSYYTSQQCHLQTYSSSSASSSSQKTTTMLSQKSKINERHWNSVGSFLIHSDNLLLKRLPNMPVFAAGSQQSLRYLSTTSSLNSTKSTDVTATKESVIDISDTTNPEMLQTALNAMSNPTAAADVSVTALNLGSNYTPIGWCVHFLDFLHSVFPWWGAIAMGTIILRLALFPVVVTAQRNAAKLNELLPEQAILKEKMNQARLVGDDIEFARLANESHTLFKRHNINPLKSMLAPISQVPVFLTFFLTLRRMANYPVESLKTGGISWVTDLSIPDPLYILPLVTGVTLWLTLEMSFRSGMNPNQTPIIKYGMRIIPVITVAFTYNFPSAIMTYWCTNNFISILQVILLRQSAVRKFLNIPPIKVKPSSLAVNKKSFKKHFSETIENAKINRIMEERKVIDDITFKKAGIGPLKKTYKYDPTSTTTTATGSRIESKH